MFYPPLDMRGLKQRALPLCAVLTALALLAPAALDVAALWGAGHDHDHGHGGHGAGWVHRSADHARHEASQLEAANPVQHAECVVCAGRSRSVVPLLLAPASDVHQDAGRAIARQASHPISDRALRPGRPRAPPIV